MSRKKKRRITPRRVLPNATQSESPLPATPANPTPASRLNRTIPWVVGLWLTLMTGWYVATGIEALHHPLNIGDDLQWAWMSVGAALTVFLSHLLVRRRIITILWLALLIAVAVAMIILSKGVISFLACSWLLLLAWAWGDWTLRLMGLREPPVTLENAMVALPLGLALMALLALALCMIERLTPNWTWITVSILTLLQWRALLKVILAFRHWFVSLRRFVGGKPVPEVGIVVVLIGFVFLLDLSWALTPEIHADALTAHLPVASYYVEHRVAVLPYFTYLGNLVNLLFALALSLHGQIVARLLVLAASCLSALGVFALGRTLFSARVGLWAAALFFSTPLVSWLATTAYVDALVTVFLLSAFLAFFRWRENRETGWLWACGLLTGAAVAAKLNALIGVPVMGLILLWDLIRSRQPVRQRLIGFVGYMLGVTLVIAPGIAIAYFLTGNPFFPLPLLQKLFPGSGGPAGNLIVNSDIFGIGTSPTALLRLPFAFTFYSQRFGEALPAGGVGLALVLAPLALATVLSGGVFARRAAILSAICLVYLGCLAFIMQYGRYYIPVLPIVVILAVAPILQLPKSKWVQRINILMLGVVFTTQLALTPLMYWNIPERFPMKMAFGQESRDSFLRRGLALYVPVQFLNKKLEPGQKVLAVGGETGRYYFKTLMTTPFDPEIKEIEAHSNETNLASNLIENGFRYLLIDRASWQTTVPLPYLREPFLKQFTTSLFNNGRIEIYSLRQSSTAPRSTATPKPAEPPVPRSNK